MPEPKCFLQSEVCSSATTAWLFYEYFKVDGQAIRDAISQKSLESQPRAWQMSCAEHVGIGGQWLVGSEIGYTRKAPSRCEALAIPEADCCPFLASLKDCAVLLFL